MKLAPFLRVVDPDLPFDECKVHLAMVSSNATEVHKNPLDAFLAKEFDEWQAWQSQRGNFSRRYVLSLITMGVPDLWLFAGTYTKLGCEARKGRQPWWFDLEPRACTADLAGRLVVRFDRGAGKRSFHRLAEVVIDKMAVEELRPEPYSIAEFPGFTDTLVTMPHLRAIVREHAPSWFGALSSVSGVYVIADRASGKLYVGSASGAGGIWARWSEYVATGHGGNVELKKLLHDEGPDRVDAFRFSILETGDSKATKDDMQRREAFWKRALLTREFGHNAN